MMARMRHAFAALAALVLAAAPAWGAERRYTVTDFDRVVVEGPFVVTLVTGRPSAAVATGGQQALERISIDVQGRTLRIRPNRSAWGGYPGERGGPVRIELATRDLRSATVLGAGSLAVDQAGGLRLDLGVEGSGRLSVDRVEADTLVVGLLGSGQVRLAGTAKTLRANIQGSGDLEAAGLTAQDAQIDSGTAGAVRLAAARTARVNALGTGDIHISGAPACTVSATGAGEVRCGRSDQR